MHVTMPIMQYYLSRERDNSAAETEDEITSDEDLNDLEMDLE
jgi:hypothetical protein